MKAIRLKDYGQPLLSDEIPRPEVDGGQVLIRVEGAGICPSDLRIARGELSIAGHLPITLGHEIAGRVAEMGTEVFGFKEGDAVLVHPGWGCGQCHDCLRGEEQLCDVSRWVGIGEDGGYAEFVLVPHARHLVRLDGLDPAAAAPLACAGLSAYKAVRLAEEVLHPSGFAVVIGAGGAGHYGVQLTKSLTGAKVLVVDGDEWRRRMSEGLGADLAIDLRDPDALEAIHDFGDGGGAQAIIDFLGTEESAQFAARVVGTAGVIILVGLQPSAGIEVSDLPYEADLFTTYGGSRSDLDDVVALAAAGKLLPEIEWVEFDSINEAFERIEQDEVDGTAVTIPR